MSDITDIQHTVIHAVPSTVAQTYPQYISPVIDALIERERQQVEVVDGIAGRYGLARGDINDILRELGMTHDLTPDPEEEPDSEDILNRVRELIEALGDVLGKN